MIFEKSAKNVKVAMEKIHLFQKTGLEKWVEKRFEGVLKQKRIFINFRISRYF